LYDKKAADRVITVGDYVTLTHQQPVTMTSLRDVAYRVVRVQGKVIACQALEPQGGQPSIKWLSKDRVRLVPELQYGLLNPRVNRYTGPSDARTLAKGDIRPLLETAPAQNPTSIYIWRKRAKYYEALPPPTPTSIHLKRKWPSQVTPEEAKRQRIACIRAVLEWMKGH